MESDIGLVRIDQVERGTKYIVYFRQSRPNYKKNISAYCDHYCHFYSFFSLEVFRYLVFSLANAQHPEKKNFSHKVFHRIPYIYYYRRVGVVWTNCKCVYGFEWNGECKSTKCTKYAYVSQSVRQQYLSNASTTLPLEKLKQNENLIAKKAIMKITMRIKITKGYFKIDRFTVVYLLYMT